MTLVKLSLLLALVSSCLTRRPSNEATVAPSPVSNSSSTSLALAPLEVPLEDPSQLNPDYAKIQSTPVATDTIAMISVSLIDIDFIKWQSCDASQSCISGWSNRPTTFLVALPAGPQTIQVQLCLRKDHSTTHAEACSPWGNGFAYTQTPRKNPTLQKWMIQQDAITQSFNNLGLELQNDLENFTSKATQCSDRNETVLQNIKATISYGPDILADNLSHLSSPLMTSASSSNNGGSLGLVDDPADTNVDPITKAANLKKQLDQNSINIAKMQASPAPATAAEQKDLEQWELKKNRLQSDLQQKNTTLKSQLQRLEESQTKTTNFPVEVNKTVQTSIDLSFKKYDAKFDTIQGLSQDQINPAKRDKLLEGLEFDSLSKSQDSVQKLRERIDNITRLKVDEYTWNEKTGYFASLVKKYNSSPEKSLKDLLVQLDEDILKNTFELTKATQFIETSKRTTAQIKSKIEEFEDEIKKDKAQLDTINTKIQLSQIQLETAQKQHVSDLKKLEEEKTYLKDELAKAEKLIPTVSPSALLPENKSVTSLNAIIPVNNQLTVSKTEKNPSAFEIQNVLDAILKDEQLKGALETNGPLRYSVLDEKSGALIALEQNGGKITMTLNIKPTDTSDTQLKAIAYRGSDTTLIKVVFPNLSQFFKVMTSLKNLNEQQFAQVLTQLIRQQTLVDKTAGGSILALPAPEVPTQNPIPVTTSPPVVNPERPIAHNIPVPSPVPNDLPSQKAVEDMPENGNENPPKSASEAIPKEDSPQTAEIPAAKEGNNFGTAAKVAVGIGTTVVIGSIVTASLAGAGVGTGGFGLANSCFAGQLSTLQSQIASVHDRALTLYNEEDTIQFLILDQLGVIDDLLSPQTAPKVRAQ